MPGIGRNVDMLFGQTHRGHYAKECGMGGYSGRIGKGFEKRTVKKLSLF